MSVNTNQCSFIKKNNQRCKRLISENTEYCWQHIDSEISKSLESLELLETLPNELIQYVLNSYIDYSEESELIENLTGVKLDIDSHLTYKTEYYKNGNIKIRKTYLDLKLIKSESWYLNTNIQNISVLDLKTGNLDISEFDINGILITKVIMYNENNFYDVLNYYPNGTLKLYIKYSTYGSIIQKINYNLNGDTI
jgi:antitoxin component YwqK of YwqJK toxin-antitoxin module